MLAFFLEGTKQTNKQLKYIKIKGFINLQFLQKLNRQKPFRDKARLSSLVNKKFAPPPTLPSSQTKLLFLQVWLISDLHVEIAPETAPLGKLN